MIWLIGVILTGAIGVGAWRGFRRGAKAIMAAWLPLVCLGVLREGLLQAGWLTPGSVLANLLLIGMFLALGMAMIRPRRKTGVPAMLSAAASSSRREMINRFGGGVLGAVYACFLCLAIATLGSALIFGVSMNHQASAPDRSDPLPPPEWLEPFKKVCNTMADLSGERLLCHIPRIGEYSHEMQALVKVLNATPEEQKRILKKRRLKDFKNLPEVKQALLDPEYRALLKQMRYGDLRALKALASHQRTEALFTCEKIRQFAQTVKPSDLLADMVPEPEPLAVKAE